MTEIIRTYEIESAWYAQVRLDSGGPIELKARKGVYEQPPDWLALAAEVAERAAEAEPIVTVEAEGDDSPR